MPTGTHHPEVIDHPTYLLANGLLTAKHDHGVHIALQSHRILDALTCLSEIDRPIHAQSICPTANNILQPLPPPLGKNNPPNPGRLPPHGTAIPPLFGNRKGKIQDTNIHTTPA